MGHATTAELAAHEDYLRAAPGQVGTLAMIVCRPGVDERVILETATLDPAAGLIGDNWLSRATSASIAAGRHVDSQLNVMSARMVGLLAESVQDQALAGDQLYLDLDISTANLPTGSRLAIGESAVIEVTAKPHTGCKKFLARFGPDALAFVNGDLGKELRLRGFNARIVTGGTIRTGDPVTRVESPA